MKISCGSLFALLGASVAAAAADCSTEDGGAPYLTALRVSSSITTPFATPTALVPPFSSDIHDYYVTCGPGVNTLTVSMTASAGAQTQINQPSASSTMPEQTVVLKVNENQAIVAAATRGTASTEYWVRCLPADFPTMLMVPHPEAGAPAPGYYLIGNETPPFGGVAYAIVLDGNGVPVWYAPQPQTGIFNTTTGAFDVDSLVQGTVSFISWPSTMATGPFEIHRLSPLSTSRVSATGLALDPHELRALSNGDFLTFTDQVQTGVDLTGYAVPLSDGGVESFGPGSSILTCDILETDPSGKLVWRWVATEHLDPVKDNTLPGLEAAPNGASVPDPFHCNSIDVDPENGNLLVSARHMDSIFYVERSSGKILWKIGGATYTKDDAVYVPAADPFYRQHDARLQPGWSSRCGGAGQISLFDDESYKPGPVRAVVYDVDVGVPGGTSGSCGTRGATVAWQRAGTGTSELMGSFRISADGSRTIGWGVTSDSTLVFTEVDDQGRDLLDFYFTQGTWSYRAIKVPLSALDLGALRSTAGRP